jgi:N-methylhydantoinase A
MIARFHAVYEQRYGNRFELIPVQGVTYRVELVVPAEKIEYAAREPLGGDNGAPTRTVELRFLADGALQAIEIPREHLAPGSRVAGPAIIREDLSTTLVCPGQTATVGRYGELVIERQAGHT